MPEPTPDQIEAEIKTLREMKPRVRRRSGFGDDHHDAIDGQLSVLEEDLSEEDIYDAHDGACDDELFYAENVKDAALEARRWLDGDEENPPSENWKELVQ